MSDAYVIELHGNAVGIIVRDEASQAAYRFTAALHGFNSLEGKEFAGPFQAETAARKLWRQQPDIIPGVNARRIRVPMEH
jgi:hypothetical protein